MKHSAITHYSPVEQQSSNVGDMDVASANSAPVKQHDSATVAERRLPPSASSVPMRRTILTKGLPAEDCFLTGYKPDTEIGDKETRNSWVKRVWVDKSTVNFWKGTHNIFIKLTDLTTEEAFKLLATDMVSTGSKGDEKTSTHIANIIDIDELRNMVAASGYKADQPHVTLHQNSRRGTYMEVTLEFPNANSSTSTTAKDKFREVQVINIHLCHNDSSGIYDSKVASTQTLKEDISREIQQYVGKFHAGEVKRNMDAITVASYEGKSYSVAAETR